MDESWIKGNCTIETLSGHKGNVSCIYCDPNIIVSCSPDDKTLKIWNPKSGMKTTTIRCSPIAPISCIYCKKINQVVSGCEDGTLRAFSLAGTPKKVFKGHTQPISCIDFLQKDDKFLIISGSLDQTLRIWDVSMVGSSLKVLEGHKNAINCIACNEECPSTVASGSEDCSFRVWNLDSGECIYSVDGNEAIVGLKLLQFGMEYYRENCSSSSSMVLTKDPSKTDGNQLEESSSDAEPWIVVSATATTIRFYNYENANLLKEIFMGGNRSEARPLNNTTELTCFFVDEYKLLTGHANGEVRLMNWLENENCEKILRKFKEHSERINMIWCDHRRMVTASTDRTIKLWQFTTKKLYKRIKNPTRVRGRNKYQLTEEDGREETNDTITTTTTNTNTTTNNSNKNNRKKQTDTGSQTGERKPLIDKQQKPIQKENNVRCCALCLIL